MSSILLSNEIVIYLFVQIVLFVLLFIAFYFSVSIIKNWDYEKTSTKQYKLEKTSYLVILIISFTLIVKIFLFPYFAYSLDNLSNIVPGAMCAAGIVGANEFGQINLALKILILFFIGVWLIINTLDLKAKTYPFTKKKYLFYTFTVSYICSRFIFLLQTYKTRSNTQKNFYISKISFRFFYSSFITISGFVLYKKHYGCSGKCISY